MSKKIKSNTLLRKIQKGASNLNVGGSRFPGFKFNEGGGISIFKKREIVQPYLHPIDSRMINEQVEKVVKNSLKSIDPKIDENYSKYLPTHLVNDIYSLYYNKSDRMKFEELDATNKVKFDILDSVNNSLIKIVTNGSHIGSYVYSEEIGKFLYKKFMELPPEQQKQFQDALNNCNQGGEGGQNKQQGGGSGQKNQQPQQKKQQPQPQKGDGNGEPGQPGQPSEGHPDTDQDPSDSQDSQGDEKSQRNTDTSARGGANNSNGKNSQKDTSQDAADQMDKDLKNMLENLSNNLNSKQAQKELDQHFKQAEQKLDKLKDIGVNIDNDEEMPEDEKKEILQNLNNLDSIRASLSRLNTSKDKVLKAVEKILNGTTNYFSQKCIQNDVELFEADQLLDINGIEFLHPFFRNSRLFDLSVTERKYIGKFDLYIDCLINIQPENKFGIVNT